jgi:hypothetical protein
VKQTGFSPTELSKYFSFHGSIPKRLFVHIPESWPNTTSAWASWRRFDITVDRYGGVHSLLLCTRITGLLSKISKGRQGQHSEY